MSIRKSRFLWEEHGWMEQEVAALWWVKELRRKLESTHHESQDRSTEAMGARETKQCAVERATATKQKLHAA